jgi:hypothetical protein
VTIPDGSHLASLVGILDAAGYERVDADVQWTKDKRIYRLERQDIAPVLVSHDGAEIRWELSLPEGIGYHGFIAVFYFADDGTLLTHGCWE